MAATKKKGANPARRPNVTRRSRTTSAGPKGSLRRTTPAPRARGRRS